MQVYIVEIHQGVVYILATMGIIKTQYTAQNERNCANMLPQAQDMFKI